jgi:flagellar FliL protein
MKSKLKIIIPLMLVVVLAGVYKFVLSSPAPVPKQKVAGEIYVLPKEFLVNTTDGRFARVGVALVMEAPGGAAGASEASIDGKEVMVASAAAAPEPPEGYGPLPQEALVRDIVTDQLSSASGDELTSPKGREKVKHHILEEIHKRTDVHATEVLFTDVAVQ